jgi:hypothetical protein
LNLAALVKDPDFGMRASGDIETLLEHKNAGRELVAADHESLPGREASGILFRLTELPDGFSGSLRLLRYASRYGV